MPRVYSRPIPSRKERPMAETDRLRPELVALLRGGNAHAKVETVIKGVPYDAINKRVADAPHTLWELVEHLRLSQRDILDFVRDPDYKWPKWPEDYWPPKDSVGSSEDWAGSTQQFLEDLETFVALVESEETEINSPIPHAPDYTVLREVLLAADHNSHHLGQFILVRRLLGCWP